MTNPAARVPIQLVLPWYPLGMQDERGRFQFIETMDGTRLRVNFTYEEIYDRKKGLSSGREFWYALTKEEAAELFGILRKYLAQT